MFKKQKLSQDIINELATLLAENGKNSSDFSGFINQFHDDFDELKTKTLAKAVEKKYGNGMREKSANDKHIKFTGLKKNDFF